MIEANPELLMNNALREHIVLQHVNQTELQFSDIQGGSFPDRKTCIFYLSLRNLVANPQYLSSCTFNIEFERLILICYVDTPDVNSIEASWVDMLKQSQFYSKKLELGSAIILTFSQ